MKMMFVLVVAVMLSLAFITICHAFQKSFTTGSSKITTKISASSIARGHSFGLSPKSPTRSSESPTALFRGNKRRRYDNDSLEGVIGTSTELTSPTIQPRWAQNALLFSSFHDGLQINPEALAFLKHGVVRKLCGEYNRWCEQQVKQSAMASPCSGPTNLSALGSMEQCDVLLKKYDQLDFSVDGQERDDIVNEMLDLMTNFLVEATNSGSDIDSQRKGEADEVSDDDDDMLATSSDTSDDSLDDRLYNIFQLNVKLVYIPTAMFALRRDSTNTPGKQRQRARADAKKRRDAIFQTLEELFENQVDIMAVTLDLNDGSIKQPQSTSDPGAVYSDKRLFPQDGKEALTSWSPHIVYVEGGNTFWLSHCINLGDWDYYIQNACCTKFTNNSNNNNSAAAVYCGKSAGAIMAGTYVETATWKGWDDPSIVPGMEEPERWKGVQGMNLLGDTNLSFFPHMTPDWTDLVSQRKSTIQGKTLAIGEDDVCIVDGRRQRYHLLSSAPQHNDSSVLVIDDKESDHEPEEANNI